MANRVRWVLAGLALLAAGGAYLGLKTASRMGAFTAVKGAFGGPCRVVPRLPGAEDMAIDRAARRVWVSSDDRAAGAAKERGAIFLMPLDGFADAGQRIDVTLGKPAKFHPHGVSLWTGPDGRQVMYVVNHPDPGAAASRVEIYDVDPSGMLAHRASVPAYAYPRINDVAGAGPDSFYATVESVFATGSVEDTTSLLTSTPAGGLVFWQDGRFRRVSDDLNFANSVALSADQKTVFATATMGRELRLYDRDLATSKLRLREKVGLDSAPDNIDIDGEGRIWIAAHPNVGAFLAHVKDPAHAKAPSQVIVVEQDPSGRGGDAHQAYVAKSGPLSAASVALVDGDRLIMGGVFDQGALACILPPDYRQKFSHRFEDVG